jgi:hypothetical protein
MTTKVVRIFDTNNSADLGDTLDGQIDVVWGLIAALETLCRESGCDAYAKGALCNCQPSRRFIVGHWAEPRHVNVSSRRM